MQLGNIILYLIMTMKLSWKTKKQILMKLFDYLNAD